MNEVVRINAAMDALTDLRLMVNGMKAAIQAAQTANPSANYQAKWDAVMRLDRDVSSIENWALTSVSRMVAAAFEEARLNDFEPHLARVLWPLGDVPTDVGLIKEAIIDPCDLKVISPREYDRLGERNAAETGQPCKFICSQPIEEGGRYGG